MNKTEIKILKDLLEHYVSLADSGDAGFWEPRNEEKVKVAIELIKKYEPDYKV